MCRLVVFGMKEKAKYGPRLVFESHDGLLAVERSRVGRDEYWCRRYFGYSISRAKAGLEFCRSGYSSTIAYKLVHPFDFASEISAYELSAETYSEDWSTAFYDVLVNVIYVF